MKRLLVVLLCAAFAFTAYSAEKKPVEKKAPKATEKKSKPPVEQKENVTPAKKEYKPIESYEVRFLFTHKNLYTLRNAVESYRTQTGVFPSANLSELVTVRFKVLDRKQTILTEIPPELISSNKYERPDSRKVVNTLGTEGGWFFDRKTGKVSVNYNKELGAEWGNFAGQNPAVQMKTKIKPVVKPVAKPVEKPTEKPDPELLAIEKETDPFVKRFLITRRSLNSLNNAVMVYAAKTGKYPSPDLKELCTTEIQIEGKIRTLLNSIPSELISTDKDEPAVSNPSNRKVVNKLSDEGGWFFDLVSGKVSVNYNKELGEEWSGYAGYNPSKGMNVQAKPVAKPSPKPEEKPIVKPEEKTDPKVKPATKPDKKSAEKPGVKKAPEKNDFMYVARYATAQQNLQVLRSAIEMYCAVTGRFPSDNLKALYTVKFPASKNTTLLKSIPPELISSDNTDPADKNPPNRKVVNKLGTEGGWFYDVKSGKIFLNYNKTLGPEWGKHAGENPSKW